MICKKCAEAGDLNRDYAEAKTFYYREHPLNCGCPCMHRVNNLTWEKLYTLERADAQND